MILNKVNKKRGLLRELNKLLPRSALLTIYKGFVRPYLDYDNIIYDHAYNATFSRNWNWYIQDNACLALTRAIRGTSEEKFYEEQAWKLCRTVVCTQL